MPNKLHLRRYLYPIASGVVLARIFPPSEFGFIAWFVLVPLFYSIGAETSVRHAFRTGYLFGFALHIFSFYWLLNLPVPLWVSLLGIASLALFSSVYTGAFTALAVFIQKKSVIPGIILYPSIWLSMEYIRSSGILGFPWLDLAYTQHRNFPLIQLASITGQSGLSLLIVFVNSVLHSMISNQKDLFSRKVLILLISVSAVYISIHSWGKHRIETQDRIADTISHVLLIQGNLSPAEKWASGNRNEKISLFCSETRQAVRKAKEKTDLVIWPETAVPAYLLDERRYRRKVLALSAELDLPILAGTLVMDPDNRSTHYNGLALFLPDGNIGACYKKIKLVPFGEMIPFEDRIPLLTKIELGQGSYSPGSEFVIFDDGNSSFGGVICFESLFSSHFRKIVNNGAQFMVVVTNDAWFGKSTAPYHHMAISSFRAIENGVSIARCANTGISCIIDPWGRIFHASGIFTKAIVEGEILCNRDFCGKTVYSKFGNILQPAALFITVLFVFFAQWNSKTES